MPFWIACRSTPWAASRTLRRSSGSRQNALPGVTSEGAVYLDAYMIIDLVEGAPDMQQRLRSAIRGRTLVSSELARLETRVGALRAQQMTHLATYGQFFEVCEMPSMDRAMFDLATDLRVRYRRKTPDALHRTVAQPDDAHHQDCNHACHGCAHFLGLPQCMLPIVYPGVRDSVSWYCATCRSQPCSPPERPPRPIA